MTRGRQRKKQQARRRQQAERRANAAATQGQSAGGLEARTVRGESGLTEIKEARLAERAIAGNWSGKKRWPTQLTKQDLENRRTTGATLIELATLESFKILEAEDPRVKGIGVRAAVMMERQNQIDDRAVAAAESDRQKLEAAAAVARADTVTQINNQITNQISVNMPGGGIQIIDPALQQKAEQYGLTQSRLAVMLGGGGTSNGNGSSNGHSSPNGHNGNGHASSDPHDNGHGNGSASDA